ncbi:hypothetical protein LVO39_002568 [Salmonella enterica]|nr:hypothetical protein [Salmonella enterica subsp. diarizonae]EBL1738905.1 hypothetical protein [Salmonella enterica]ECD7244692.1 hypothetical protein [Salmonella enterica subsp. enterica serovar Florida]ECF4168045.1 hypothetical protein [Salmonella enterica subsp. enterica serovar Florida]ECW2476711.1 hypothetical protein [Salmonella enterica subsp. enterica serovar Florida]
MDHSDPTFSLLINNVKQLSEKQAALTLILKAVNKEFQKQGIDLSSSITAAHNSLSSDLQKEYERTCATALSILRS